jgi:hypothetical protein
VDTLLANIRSVPQPDGGPAKLEADVGSVRTIGVIVLGALCVIGAVVLFALDKNTGGTAILGFATTVLSGGLGFALGEQRGVESAQQRLQGGQ